MPDLYCRTHASTKAGAFGLSLVLMGIIIAMSELRVLIQALMIIGFFYLTAPVAAHMIGRVALQRKVNWWRRTNAFEQPRQITRTSKEFKGK